MERLVRGKLVGSGELQSRQRYMRAVQIDRENGCGIGGQVGEDVAAARRDGDHSCAGLQRQRFQVDFRVFPDLRIDEAAEGEGEDAFADSVARCSLEAMNRLAKRIGGPKTLRCLTRHRHASSRITAPKP